MTIHGLWRMLLVVVLCLCSAAWEGRAHGTSTMEYDTDRPGSDYRNFDLQQARPELCRDACAADVNCQAFTYVKPGIQGRNARCWLKSRVPNAVASTCCVSGTRVSSAGGGGAPTGGSGQYLGCFKDQGRPRDLSGFVQDSRFNSTEKCVSLCRSKGFAYAGTQYSSYCFCGNSYGRYGQANNCNMRCTGDKGQICGGSWANSVYSTGASGGGGQRFFKSRWDKIGGSGGAWSTGWVPNHPKQVCGHYAAGCSCAGQNYCGEYNNGAVTYWWPQGCNGPRWQIRCTSVPQ